MAETEEELCRYFEEQVENSYHSRILGFLVDEAIEWKRSLSHANDRPQSLPQLKSREH
jgi:uncharacterized membrane protein